VIKNWSLIQVEVSWFSEPRSNLKLDENGNVHYLVSWLPAGMFADEWVSKKEMKIHRQVPISQLPSLLKTRVEKQIFGVTSLNSGRKQQKVSGPPKLT